MKKDQIVNYTTKNIRQFIPEDTIYIQKLVNGHSYNILCQFEKFEKGIVHATVIECEQQFPPFDLRKAGTPISSRLKKCYLWGNDHKGHINSMQNDHCIWFDKDGFAK